MDPITKAVLDSLMCMFHNKAVRLTHQFLCGTDGKECGIVPNNWDGGTVLVTGQWWKGRDFCRIHVSQ